MSWMVDRFAVLQNTWEKSLLFIFFFPHPLINLPQPQAMGSSSCLGKETG